MQAAGLSDTGVATVPLKEMAQRHRAAREKQLQSVRGNEPGGTQTSATVSGARTGPAPAVRQAYLTPATTSWSARYNQSTVRPPVATTPYNQAAQWAALNQANRTAHLRAQQQASARTRPAGAAAGQSAFPYRTGMQQVFSTTPSLTPGMVAPPAGSALAEFQQRLASASPEQQQMLLRSLDCLDALSIINNSRWWNSTKSPQLGNGLSNGTAAVECGAIVDVYCLHLIALLSPSDDALRRPPWDASGWPLWPHNQPTCVIVVVLSLVYLYLYFRPVEPESPQRAAKHIEIASTEEVEREKNQRLAQRASDCFVEFSNSTTHEEEINSLTKIRDLFAEVERASPTRSGVVSAETIICSKLVQSDRAIIFIRHKNLVCHHKNRLE
ncbi:Bromodomain containing protein 7 [Perkinsus olseni]|uniref:Bromodomain containing protein 7 n=1 Tax=Perkinsus olseni TaxID=32597 RepID=A0A7J6SMH1_PEROL|nr:Bromodomain containing protein 7 [Perkinsus olseni]